ncbi:MAG: hypothetical protein ACTSRS_18875 [Candidatus Helarchaeota archaeon]
MKNESEIPPNFDLKTFKNISLIILITTSILSIFNMVVLGLGLIIIICWAIIVFIHSRRNRNEFFNIIFTFDSKWDETLVKFLRFLSEISSNTNFYRVKKLKNLIFDKFLEKNEKTIVEKFFTKLLDERNIIEIKRK